MLNAGLLSLARPALPKIVACVCAAILAAAAGVLQITAVAQIAAILWEGAPRFDKLLIWASVIVAAAVGRAVLITWQERASVRIATGLKIGLRDKLIAKVLDLGVGYLDRDSTGALTTTASEGIEALEVYFGRYLPQLFVSVLTPIGLFIYLMFIDARTAALLLIAVPLIPASIMLIMKWAGRVAGNHWKNYAKLSSFFLDSLQGLTELKLFNRHNARAKRIAEKSWTFRNATMRLLRMNLTSIIAMDWIAYGGAAAGILLAGESLKTEDIGIFGATVILLAAPQFFLPLRALGAYFHAGLSGVSAATKIFAVLKQPLLLKQPEQPESLYGKPPSIVFHRVGFSYDNSDSAALRDVSFELPAGSTTAVVGPSGCGKSTIIALIARLFDPSSGTVSFGGTDLSRVPPGEIHKRMAVVNQEPVLFSGTVADNLRLAEPDASTKELYSACRRAGIEDLVRSLPGGLDAEIGERGARLSGGQRQRLALARAVLKNADVLLLDEATSSVDARNESLIQDAVSKISADMTTVIVAHRLSTVRHADTILVVDQGEIIERGAHDALMAKDGLYARLVRAQLPLEVTHGA